MFLLASFSLLGFLFGAPKTHAAVQLRYEVPMASVTVPVECTGAYAHAFVAPAGSAVTGTSENDIIFADAGSAVHAGNGDDCIVVTNNSSAKGEGGNDILVSTSGGNSLDGGVGTDTAYYYFGSDGVHNDEVLIKL